MCEVKLRPATALPSSTRSAACRTRASTAGLRASTYIEFATDQRTVGDAAEAIEADEVGEGDELDRGIDQTSIGGRGAGDRGEGGECRGAQEELASLHAAGVSSKGGSCQRKSGPRSGVAGGARADFYLTVPSEE